MAANTDASSAVSPLSSTVAEEIIVGYDGSSEARDALALGRLLAKLSHRHLVLAVVLPIKEEPIGLEGYRRALRKDSEQILAAAIRNMGGLEVQTRALGDQSPAEALQALAEAESAHMIVVGSTHRGPLGRIYPGSVAEQLLNGAPCAVAVAPRGFALREIGDPRVFAAAFDGSPESLAALDLASQLSGASEATLRVIAVYEPLSPGAATMAPLGATAVGALTRSEALAERLDEAVSDVPCALRAKGLLLHGQAAEELLRETTLGVDLLVMGSRGRGRLGRVLLGSVSARVVRSATCPVVVVPRSAGRQGRTRARAKAALEAD